ncbi:AMP-binding protein [Falsigemmobacter intermedius]|uniref:ATP-dependent acyl-CoA ligase n=1 Tax=Falsigemmobacter intermedius TaxID=1553448 RepID=A0A3S3WFS6_9RHOB|nr:AMP-binding protein [Falsigemmobacter intermedius]RWY37660.1 ATP-dependent acyl-CoA ligase [Falsigemmobacter intermedius]
MTTGTVCASDPALDRNRAVLRYILETYAAERPEAPFVQFWPGDEWSYGETLRRVRLRATTLARAGVKRGDHVLCMMGNGPDLLCTWFAINYLGAVYVPINTAARGRVLEHILDDADAPLLVAAASLVERLGEVSPGKVKTVLVVEGEAQAVAGLDVRMLEDPVEEEASLLELSSPIEPWDLHAIMYTSGTTGNAKGVMSSYTQLYTMGPDAFDCVEEDDRCMICGPIFHCGSTLYVYAMLARGLSIGMTREFKTGTFWQAVRETGSTYCLLLGVMASFLLKQPPSSDDKNHPLRRAFITPFGEDGPLFAERFGVDAWTIYNMTEISSPMVAGPGITAKGIAGKPRPWYEMRIVDENDIEVPDGQVGELIVRTHRPWALMRGYYNNPKATVEAMRNGWFHTGDGFRREKDGTYFFVDRLKDVIRRRGENISSFALENEVLNIAAIRECAAVAVPSEFSEDEVLIFVTPVEGATIDPVAVTEELTKTLPQFMVPRYIRILDELPKTASGKVQKHILRSAGVTPDTFDRTTQAPARVSA